MNKNGFEDRSEDRRVRKSKKALEEALIRLLAKKTITEITVTELTEEADIHRGTFYNHYKDTMDLKISDRPRHRRPADRAAQLCAGKRAEGRPLPAAQQGAAVF